MATGGWRTATLEGIRPSSSPGPRPRSAWVSSIVAACVALSGLAGCDKLRAIGKAKGDDAGSASSGAGTGVLSFLGTDFEGEITAHVTTKGNPQAGVPQQLVFGIKKPKYRVDMSGGAPSANPAFSAAGALLLDPVAKKGWIMMPAQKTAMVVDFEKMKSMPKAIPGLPNAPKGMPTSTPSQPPTIDKTGKKDVVAGYSCEIWNVVSEGKKSEACVAEGITWIDLTDLGWSSPELTVAAVASEANRFPLRVITFDAKGAEELRMEVTKVDRKKLDEARFVVPADYRVVDLAAMMGGLGAKGGPRVPPQKPH